MQQILNLQHQICQFNLDGVWDCSVILGSFLISLSSEAVGKGESLPPFGAGSYLESLAIFADTLKGKQEYKRAIDYYKRAHQQAKLGAANTFKQADGVDRIQTNSHAVCIINAATAMRSAATEIGQVEAQILFEIAKCQVHLAEVHTALKTLEAVPARYKTPSMHLFVGSLYSNTGKERGAVNNYRDALRQNSYAVQAALGMLKHHSPASDVAMLCARAPISSQNDLPWLENLIEAHGHSYTNHYKQAISSFQALAQRFPDNIHVLTSIAYLYVQSNDHDAAVIHFQNARSSDPKSLEKMDVYASLIRSENDASRLNSLAKSLMDVNDNRPEPWVAAAMFCELKGDGGTAKEFVDKALELQPNHLAAYHFRGELNLELNPERSVIDFYKAYSISKDYTAYEGLVESYLKLKKISEALRTAKEALSLMPKDARTIMLVGKVLAQTAGDGQKKAIKAFTKSLKLDPSCSDAAIAIADLTLAHHKADKTLDLKPAIDMVNQSLQYHNTDIMQSKLGLLHSRAMNYSYALTHFHNALSMNPKCETAKQGIEMLERLMRGVDPDKEEDIEIDEAAHSYIDQDV